MKKTMFLFLLLLSGCLSDFQGDKKCEPVIVWKRADTYTGYALAPELCRYGYLFRECQTIEFLDSCFKYNVGDTIVGKKVTQ